MPPKAAPTPPQAPTGPGFTQTGYRTRPGAANPSNNVITAFQNANIGPGRTGVNHVHYRTEAARQVQLRLVPAATVNNNLHTIGGFSGGQSMPNPASYEEVYILDPYIASELSKSFALVVRYLAYLLLLPLYAYMLIIYQSEELARAADFPIRPYGSTGYETPHTPIVARKNSVTGERLVQYRQSYLKALICHSRGMQNAVPCQRCRPAYEHTAEFPVFAGCFSLPGWWGGACSNCIWTDHAATCVHHDKDFNKKLPYDEWKKDRDDRSRSPDSPDKRDQRRDPRTLKAPARSGLRSNTMNNTV